MCAEFQISFVSALPSAFRAELEDLLFFNPEQGRFQKTILDSLQKYGSPALVETERGIEVNVEGIGKVQALFALVSDPAESVTELAGAILFYRVQPEKIRILHWVVAPEFLWNGEYGDAMLACRLIDAVRDVACRISGVRKVSLHYQRGRLISWNV